MTQTPQISESAARELLVDGDTSATALMALALSAFPQLLEMEEVESIEIWMALEEKYGVTISELCENRVNALWLTLLGDAFYDDPEVFTAVCAALFDGDIGDPIDAITDDLGVEEILWACYEVSLWHGELQEFGPRVQAVIRRTMETDALDTDEGELIVSRAKHLKRDLALLGLDESELDNFLFNNGVGQTYPEDDEAPAIAGFAEPR